MSYRSCWVDRTFVVRWTAEPERRDFDQIVQSLTDGQTRFSDKVCFVNILPAEISGGNQGIRRAFVERLDRMLAACTCVVAVIEGEGLTHSIRMNVMIGITMMAGKRGLYVRKSVEDAFFHKRPPELVGDGQTIIKELQKRNLLTNGSGGASSAK